VNTLPTLLYVVVVMGPPLALIIESQLLIKKFPKLLHPLACQHDSGEGPGGCVTELSYLFSLFTFVSEHERKYDLPHRQDEIAAVDLEDEVVRVSDNYLLESYIDDGEPESFWFWAFGSCHRAPLCAARRTAIRGPLSIVVC
jgi:hypothetical protein